MKIKGVLLGNSGVGKTAIANRASTGSFSSLSHPTIGAAHFDVQVRVDGGRSVVFSVWDTAGQEQFRTVVPIYFRNASVAMLVFSLTERQSFEDIQEWVTLLKRNVDECVIALVGNKSDLSNRAIFPEEGEELQQQIGANFYIETSAASGENIESLFHQLAEIIDINHDGEFGGHTEDYQGIQIEGTNSSSYSICC